MYLFSISIYLFLIAVGANKNRIIVLLSHVSILVTILLHVAHLTPIHKVMLPRIMIASIHPHLKPEPL